jgi:hypothetical protein
MHDIIGLYLDPLAPELVLAVGGKSQIQALDRTQPGLPMKKGRSGNACSATGTRSSCASSTRSPARPRPRSTFT